MFGPRILPGETLEDIMDRVSPPGDTLVCSTLDMNLQSTDIGLLVNVRAGAERDIVEIPGENALVAFSDLLKIPTKFLSRVPKELAADIINILLHQTPGEVKVRFGDYGIYDIVDANRKSVASESLVDIAISVLGEDAKVIEWWYDPQEFRLDVVSPDGGPRVGGDRAVGDLTHGGLRIVQDIKHNLAPSVSKLMYRLICTNSMEVPDISSKVDARGSTIDEMIDSLEIIARRLYAEVDNDITDFYNLRQNKLTHPEQSVLRIAREAGLSDRVQLNAVELAPELFESEEPTEFDLVNAFTNLALRPGTKAGTRRQLELVGGTLVADHTARCSHCASRLV